MSDEELLPGAAYGLLAFDLFVMDHHSPTIPPPTPQQWRSLTRSYLALPPRQRFPYHDKAWQRTNDLLSSPLIEPDPTHCAHLFLPHQTPRERNLAARLANKGCHNPLWVRTCYDVELEGRYKEIKEMVLDGSFGDVVEEGGVFDFDEGRYGDKGQEGDGWEGEEGGNSLKDWERILLRVPEMCDVVRYGSEEMYEELEREVEEREEEEGARAKVDRMVVMRVYVVDRQTLEDEGGWVKVVWLDWHGECVGENRLEAERILDFNGAWLSTVSMQEIVETYAESEERGARLVF